MNKCYIIQNFYSFWRQWVSTEGRTLEEASTHFWMPREVGVSTRCTFQTDKGKILRVAEAKCIVPRSWSRLSYLGNWLSVRSMKHM